MPCAEVNAGCFACHRVVILKASQISTVTLQHACRGTGYLEVSFI